MRAQLHACFAAGQAYTMAKGLQDDLESPEQEILTFGEEESSQLFKPSGQM